MIPSFAQRKPKRDFFLTCLCSKYFPLPWNAKDLAAKKPSSTVNQICLKKTPQQKTCSRLVLINSLSPLKIKEKKRRKKESKASHFGDYENRELIFLSTALPLHFRHPVPSGASGAVRNPQVWYKMRTKKSCSWVGWEMQTKRGSVSQPSVKFCFHLLGCP